jgi:hypothetical protein
LLQQLGARLQHGISWELKRELVATLVDGAQINTVETKSGREAVVNVRYRFNPFSSDCTGIRASFNCTLKRVYRLPPGERRDRK